MREPIADFSDPRLDDYRNIPDSRLRVDDRVFIAEGRLVVRRLLESHRFPVRSLMVTAVAGDAVADALAAHPGLPVYEVEQETMNRVAGFDVHRGCLAIGERIPCTDPEPLLTARRLVGLEAVGNADNVGSIFRHASAFGVGGVLLDGATVDPLYRKSLRTSMGAALTVPFARIDDWLGALARCRRAGTSVIALTPALDAEPIESVASVLRREPAILIVGSEGEGLSAAALDVCTVRARIPMQAGVDSLNVATAAAIAMYEMSRVVGSG
ncbi:MAG: RNA methyltransferase [Vicinamibacterales bacterium]